MTAHRRRQLNADWMTSAGAVDGLPSAAFRAFVDTTSDSIVWMSADLTILYANDAFLDDFDRSRHEIVGRSLIDLVPAPQRAETRARLERVRAVTPDDPTITVEFQGQKGWLSSVYRGWFDEDGALIAITDHARDISEAYAARVELQTMNRRLAESNRDLQDFASVASHDLREPLRKIATFGRRLGQGYSNVLDERGVDYLDRLNDAATRMQELIDDVLTFAHLATNDTERSCVSAQQVVAGVLSDLEIQIAECGATIEVGQLPDVMVDAVQLRQVFQNLIGNALKFRHSNRSPTIRIEARQTSRPGSGLQIERLPVGWAITVSDDGIGFENEYREWIFTPFQRLHGRSNYPGTGMGLAVCRRIAERHDGTLVADGRPGEGATFTLWLPVAAECEDDLTTPDTVD